jgi:type IV secretion system protein VirD4
MEEERKKRKWIFYLVFGIIGLIVSLVGGSFLAQAWQNNFSFKNIEFTLKGILAGFKLGQNFWISTIAVASGLVSIPVLFSNKKSSSGSVPSSLLGNKYDTPSDKKGAAKWLTTAEVNKVFPKYSYSTAGRYKVNGFVVQTTETKNDTFANLRDEVHCLIIGTTGSGKTIRFVVPTMQFQARSALRPSIIVTDPKGELYQNQSKLYQDRGYDIITINLREPLKRSNCWNPCYIAYSYYQEALQQKQKIKFHYDAVEQYQGKLEIVSNKNDYSEEWYEFNNYAFADLKDAVLEAERAENTLKSKAIESINDLVTTIYAESEKKAQDPFWVKSAKSLVEGLLLAMLEDSEIEELGITSQQFNLGTVATTLSLRLDHLKSYFAIRDVSSFAKRKAQGPIVAPQSGTQESIISTAMADLAPFSDPDIQYITCNNDIMFKDIGRKPTAVFLIIPDEKENRHVFASLFITQSYKALVELAAECGGKVPHPVNYIIDEFANLPVIPGMDNKITVARSRGLAFLLIIQSLSQLRAKYGPDIAEIIKTNCNLQVFLATNDNETAEYFSKICGEKTIKEVSSSKDGATGKENLTYSLSARALIKPEELLTIPEGVSIVKLLRTQPAKLKQIAFWKSRAYYRGEQVIDTPWNPKLFVFENDGYYDVVNRNKNDAEYLKDQLEEYDLDIIKEERAKERALNEREFEEFAGASGAGGEGGGAIFGDKFTDYTLNTDLNEFKLNTNLDDELKKMTKTKETTQDDIGLGEAVDELFEDINSIETPSLDDNLDFDNFVQDETPIKTTYENEPVKEEFYYETKKEEAPRFVPEDTERMFDDEKIIENTQKGDPTRLNS